MASDVLPFIYKSIDPTTPITYVEADTFALKHIIEGKGKRFIILYYVVENIPVSSPLNEPYNGTSYQRKEPKQETKGL